MATTEAYAVGGQLSLLAGGPKGHFRDVMPSQTHDLGAGASYGILAGLSLPFAVADNAIYEAQVNAGYLGSSKSAEKEGSREEIASFSCLPVEALYYYRKRQIGFRAGYGLVAHLGGRVSSKEPGGNADIRDALGWVIALETNQIDAENASNFSFGIRYTSITYKSEAFTRDLDGSTFSFVLSLVI